MANSSDGHLFVELSNLPPSKIRKVIEKFRNSVVGNYKIKKIPVDIRTDPATGQSLEQRIMDVPVLDNITRNGWADKMRIVFASIGELVASPIPEATASTLQIGRAHV